MCPIRIDATAATRTRILRVVCHSLALRGPRLGLPERAHWKAGAHCTGKFITCICSCLDLRPLTKAVRHSRRCAMRTRSSGPSCSRTHRIKRRRASGRTSRTWTNVRHGRLSFRQRRAPRV
ncbi:hypothetical protein C8Q74DRAFT_525324 [Fomes fomentarius]|nr:hypothetical protein C8Q74DRAFT_525324 [Fomes fomentarius]